MTIPTRIEETADIYYNISMKSKIVLNIARENSWKSGTSYNFGNRDAREIEEFGKNIKITEEWFYLEDEDAKPKVLRLFRHFKFVYKTQWTIKATIG